MMRPPLAEKLDLEPHLAVGCPSGDSPVLVSCVVAPGFDFADFRLA